MPLGTNWGMTKYWLASVILSACAGFGQTATNLSGAWAFTCMDDRLGGWIVIEQSGSTFAGTWHTSRGEFESDDDDVTGRIDGNRVVLWRFIGDDDGKQSFVLTLSPDGTRLDGSGDGYLLDYTNLNMQRSGATRDRGNAAAAAPVDLSGFWAFTHFNDRFQGAILLRVDGVGVFSGVWHTSKGKVEPDDAISCHVDGNTVTLWRFIGNKRQYYALTLSADRSRLDGYGDGYSLNHTNLNMVRVADPAASAPVAPAKPR